VANTIEKDVQEEEKQKTISTLKRDTQAQKSHDAAVKKHEERQIKAIVEAYFQDRQGELLE